VSAGKYELGQLLYVTLGPSFAPDEDKMVISLIKILRRNMMKNVGTLRMSIFLPTLPNGN
jgi:hypothetical protein